MILKIVDKSLLTTTAFLLLLVLIIPAILDYSNIIFLIFICVVGIPHGALDHIIHFRDKSITKRDTFAFYLRYIALIVLVAICWYFFPLASFAVFMMVSAYHFGQSQLFYIKGPAVFRNAFFLIWGVFVLASIISLNYEECLAILSSLEWLQVSTWMSAEIWVAITGVAGLFQIAAFTYLLKIKYITKDRLGFELLVLLCLILLSTFTNAVFTFSIYFGLWHSLRSLFIEFQSLSNSLKNYSLQHFLRNIFPFSFLAIIFLVISYYLTTYFLKGLSPYMLFIIFISTLTVPHLLIMHDLYENHQANLPKS